MSSITNKVIIIILVLIRRTYTLFHYNITEYRKSDKIVLRIIATTIKPAANTADLVPK